MKPNSHAFLKIMTIMMMILLEDSFALQSRVVNRMSGVGGILGKIPRVNISQRNILSVATDVPLSPFIARPKDHYQDEVTAFILSDSSSVLASPTNLSRGGAALNPAVPAQQATKQSPSKLKQVVVGSTLTVMIVTFLYLNRHSPLLDKQLLQDAVLAKLALISDHPFGICYYVMGLAVWELLGLSTIPVETAAGMAFPLHNAILANLAGKLSGATMAFLIGRYALSKHLRPILQQQPVFLLLEQSLSSPASSSTTTSASPLVTTLFLKYSCLPEFVKNFGASLVQPIPFFTFLCATLLHGGPFSVLWTFLGHDTAIRLVLEGSDPNVALQISLVLAAVVGLVVSPLSMAWWIQDMRSRLKQPTTQMTPSRKRHQ